MRTIFGFRYMNNSCIMTVLYDYVAFSLVIVETFCGPRDSVLNLSNLFPEITKVTRIWKNYCSLWHIQAVYVPNRACFVSDVVIFEFLQGEEPYSVLLHRLWDPDNRISVDSYRQQKISTKEGRSNFDCALIRIFNLGYQTKASQEMDVGVFEPISIFDTL